ncbi:type II toxin-antitoxin system ChpB family toxin [Chitinilyticum litopenaei]|uniref:type II toxin-antitoxin system ChpB family toxin n=1 Tax=Chitinilyticum litopenaei TaxID=1121276 RepID=UPI000427CBF3|nr:type II toxin-antitoxin system ChpB family toxin [Chitinilyticum litopenaei]
MKAFRRGDIVRVCLNPTVGREQQGDMRPALVLSSEPFNKMAGVAVIAPISQGANFARVAGFTASLSGSGCETQGVVVASMLRSVDLQGRQAKFVETAPDYVVADVLARVQAIFD